MNAKEAHEPAKDVLQSDSPPPDEEGLTKKRKKKHRKEEAPPRGTSRGVDTMFRTSYRQHVDLSGLADNKSNIMISINGIIISIIIASISPRIEAHPWLLAPTTVLLLTCLISLVYAVLSARPRVTSTPITLDDVRRHDANVLFFGNFVNLPREDFTRAMKELLEDSEELYATMMRDIYGLGQVLARKFRLLRVSYTVFMIGLVIAVVLYIVVFIGVVAYPRVPPEAGVLR
jgi:hypothetical protein